MNRWDNERIKKYILMIVCSVIFISCDNPGVDIDEVHFSNSDLSNQSSETLVFSRKIGILILVPYVFSLVFALMSRNKGNFLFRLPRPPYQAVLRKFVSLLS